LLFTLYTHRDTPFLLERVGRGGVKERGMRERERERERERQACPIMCNSDQWERGSVATAPLFHT
jgi:hypothetical protein